MRITLEDWEKDIIERTNDEETVLVREVSVKLMYPTLDNFERFLTENSLDAHWRAQTLDWEVKRKAGLTILEVRDEIEEINQKREEMLEKQLVFEKAIREMCAKGEEIEISRVEMESTYPYFTLFLDFLDGANLKSTIRDGHILVQKREARMPVSKMPGKCTYDILNPENEATLKERDKLEDETPARKTVQPKDLYSVITIPWDEIEEPAKTILKERQKLKDEIQEIYGWGKRG